MTDAPATADHTLALLSELAELGMQLARQIVAAPADHDDPALAFDRVSRAVRLTLMLRDKLAREPSEPAERRKARVQRILSRIVERQHGGDSAKRQAAERLDRDFCGDILNQPISELIAMICKDLRLTPDWPRLAQEAWALDEIASGQPGRPFLGFPLPLAEDGGAKRRMRGPEVEDGA